MMIDVEVVQITPGWVTVQYEDGGYLERKMIPWEAFPCSEKGPARIRQETLAMGMDYSDVYLEDCLGKELPPIRVRDVQDALRRGGLWRREDYRNSSQIVAGVVQRLRGADTTRIVNAALSRPKEIEE